MIVGVITAFATLGVALLNYRLARQNLAQSQANTAKTVEVHDLVTQGVDTAHAAGVVEGVAAERARTE